MDGGRRGACIIRLSVRNGGILAIYVVAMGDTMRMLSKYRLSIGFIFATAALLLFNACGGNGSTRKEPNTPTPPPVTSPSIFPATANIKVGDSRIFTVTTQNNDFSLSVSPLFGSGCIKSGNNTVTCTPTTAGMYEITVTETTAPSKKAMARVTVADNEIDIGDRPILGSDSAKIILLNFSNYQCPFCGQYARNTFPSIKEQYIDTGKIRYAVVDFPFEHFEYSEKAAQASRCGGDQGKYWEISELMFHNPNYLGNLGFFAEALNLDAAEFNSCLDTEKYRDAVKEDFDLAVELKIDGVPNFFIGVITDPTNPRVFQFVWKITGAVPFEEFQRLLDVVFAANP